MSSDYAIAQLYYMLLHRRYQPAQQLVVVSFILPRGQPRVYGHLLSLRQQQYYKHPEPIPSSGVLLAGGQVQPANNKLIQITQIILTSHLPMASSVLPTSGVAAELTWLCNKKITYLSELQQFETQTQANLNALMDLNDSLTKLNSQLNDELQSLKRGLAEKEASASQQLQKYKCTLQKWQTENQELKLLIKSKEDAITALAQKLSSRQKLIRDQDLRLLEMENSMEEKLKQKDRSIQELTESNNQNIQNMICKYEQLIEQRVSTIEKQYQQELQQIRQNNKAMIQELESKSKQSQHLNKEEVKKNEEDAQRLIMENKKLLFQVNEAKRKLLNLENELEASRQEVKVMAKEKQISGFNAKRQIQCLKENKQEMQEKVKKLQQSMDENLWEMKQAQMQKEKETRKIKEESERIVDEVVTSYRAEISDFKLQLKELKDTNDGNLKKYEEMRKERDSAHQLIESLKKANEANSTHKAQEEKKHELEATQEKAEMGKLKGINAELKKEILRKSAQVEVLKEEVSRLKVKVNKLTVAYQENLKSQEVVEKENKMLLSEIVYLRDRNKSKLMSTHKKAERDIKNSRMSNNVLEVRSEQSEILDNSNQNEELEMYKLLIVEMEKDMNEAVAKLDEKNNIIEKQKAIIERLQRALSK